MAMPIARRPVNQWVYACSTGWLFVLVFNSIQHGISESYLEFAVDWIVIAAFTVIWPLLTTGRLADIGLDKRWVAPFALPWAAFVVTALRGPKLAALAALALLLATQSFLVLPTKPVRSALTIHAGEPAE